jgi:hypothetical protein
VDHGPVFGPRCVNKRSRAQRGGLSQSSDVIKPDYALDGIPARMLYGNWVALTDGKPSEAGGQDQRKKQRVARDQVVAKRGVVSG